jgi:hypothetical protein
MPVTTNISGTQNYNIPSDIYSLTIRLWGAGGGGEFVSTAATQFAVAGSSGGSTSFVGLVAGGGQGGGIGGKGQGGSGGSTSSPYNWVGNQSASVSFINGNGGGLSAGGTGLTLNSLQKGGGGNGTVGAASYTSTSFHVFDNDSNQHIITQTSPDLSVSYENPGAPDGLSCSPNYGTKHYRVRFNVPFVDASYGINVFSICQQAAGGATNGPYYQAGILGKNSSEFRIWFCNGNAKNGYIRCFSFTASGIKSGATGKGGGSGAAIQTTLTRQMLQGSGTYAPGTTHTVTIGSGGSSGGNTATSGFSGYAQLYAIIIPKVTLTASSYAIVVGQSVTLSWFTTGDGDSITWTAGGLSNNNLTSSATVSPQLTTTYTAIANGLGGSSAPATVTIVVYQIPTASITVPESLLYGQNAVISYTTKYANTSITLTPYYTYLNGSTEVAGTSITLPAADSAENGKPDSQTVRSNSSLTVTIPYNDFGPTLVRYVLTANGSGGSVTITDSTEIIIDQTPDNIVIPEKEDAFKSQDPVFAPETDILSELLLVTDIDIPVEIKSNAPIKVDINGQENWIDVRQL